MFIKRSLIFNKFSTSPNWLLPIWLMHLLICYTHSFIKVWFSLYIFQILRKSKIFFFTHRHALNDHSIMSLVLFLEVYFEIFLRNVATYYILRTKITLRMNITSRLFVSVSNIKTLNQFIKDKDETPLCIFETIPIRIIQENAAKEYPAMCFKALRSHQVWRITTTRSVSLVCIKRRSVILIC